MGPIYPVLSSITALSTIQNVLVAMSGMLPSPLVPYISSDREGWSSRSKLKQYRLLGIDVFSIGSMQISWKCPMLLQAVISIPRC